MINVSSDFKKAMEKRTDFLTTAEITFIDGTVIKLDSSDFTINNNGVVEGANSNTIPLGLAVSKRIQLEMVNFDSNLSQYDFYGSRIRLFLKFKISDILTERILLGTFTVVEPATYGTTIILSAIDDMYKADKTYTTKLVFPATIGNMLADICSSCDITQGKTEFANSDFVVDEVPTGKYTYRSIIGFIAMLAGGNAKIDRDGKLQIVTYDLATSSYHTLSKWKNLKLDTSDIKITGIQTILSDDTVLLHGEEGYTLEISNPLISGKEADALPLIAEKLINQIFRQFEGDHIAYPLAEFMDLALIIDTKGNEYKTFITDIDFNFLGYTTFKNSAEQVLENGRTYPSEAVRVEQELKELIQKEKTDREVMVENIASELAKNSSMFTTEEVQDDGGSIYYVHNKPTLEESDVVWKLTVEAIGISTDGGKTYPYALDVSGMAVLERIYAVGINANYITTGAFTVRGEDGNIVFSADKDTGNVIIAALTAFKNELGEYLRINPEDESISLGSSKNPIILKVINNKISFTQNGQDIAWFSDNQLYVASIIITQSATICGLKITMDGLYTLIN